MSDTINTDTATQPIIDQQQQQTTLSSTPITIPLENESTTTLPTQTATETIMEDQNDQSNNNNNTNQTPSKSTFALANSQGQLELEHQWDVYHIDPQSVATQVQNNCWDPIFMASFHTVRDFWCIFNNIVPPTYLPKNTFIYVFKHGVAPKWESIENKNGGELSFIFDTSISQDNDREYEDLCTVFEDAWINTLLALIGEYFSNSTQINGVCVAARVKFIKVSLWLSTCDDNIIQSIKKEWLENSKIDDIKFKPFSK